MGMGNKGILYRIVLDRIVLDERVFNVNCVCGCGLGKG
jgi:hypothetical protein